MITGIWTFDQNYIMKTDDSHYIGYFLVEDSENRDSIIKEIKEKIRKISNCRTGHDLDPRYTIMIREEEYLSFEDYARQDISQKLIRIEMISNTFSIYFNKGYAQNYDITEAVVKEFKAFGCSINSVNGLHLVWMRVSEVKDKLLEIDNVVWKEIPSSNNLKIERKL